MTLKQQLIIVLADKALIGAILVGLGFWLNKRLEIVRASRSLLNALVQQHQKVEDDLAVSRRARRLEFLEQQLSSFYWPLYLRLQKDNAMWKRLGQLNAQTDNALPEEAARAVEQGYILPNHDQTVALIEQNAHLIDDNDLFAALLLYVKHVAVYQAMRTAPSLDGRNPTDLGEPYPEALFPLVEGKLRTLRDEYQRLLHSSVLDEQERAGTPGDGSARVAE